jgi:hypothetical protein
MSMPSIIFLAINESTLRWTYFAVVQVFPVFVALGVAGAAALTGFPRTDLVNFESRGISKVEYARPGLVSSRILRKYLDTVKRKGGNILVWAYLASLVSMIGIGAAYLIVADRVPVFMLFRGQHLTEGGARFVAYDAPPLLIFLHALGVRVSVPIGIICSYLLAKSNSNKRVWWRLVFLSNLLLSLAFSLITLERQAPLAVFAFLACTSLFVDGFKRFFLIGCICGIGSGVFGFVVTWGQYGDAAGFEMTGLNLLRFITMRVVVDPAYMAYAVMNMYDQHDLLFGANIKVLTPLLELLGYKYEGLTAIGIVPDLWINFGWVGVTVGAGVLGFVLQVYEVKLLQGGGGFYVVSRVTLTIGAIWLLYSNILPVMITSMYLVFGVILLYLKKRRFSVSRFHFGAVRGKLLKRDSSPNFVDRR